MTHAVTEVITYQAPNGETLTMCLGHEHALARGGLWPKNDAGEEYCTVSRGVHDGTCDLCRNIKVSESGGQSDRGWAVKERVCFFCDAKSSPKKGAILAVTLTNTGRIYTHAVCLGREQARLRAASQRGPK